MVMKQEVLSELDMQELDEAQNIDLPDEKFESGSKGRLIELAGQLRDHHDELNRMAPERVSKRDGLNVEAHEEISEAQKHRERHDKMSPQVQEHKQSRSKFNTKANELFGEVDEVKSDLELGDGKDIDELKEEIEQLEPRQQIGVLSTRDERELIEKIENKHEELHQRKDEVEESDDLEELIEEVEETRSEASQHRQKVTELADDAQGHHSQMIEVYREADNIRDKADEMREPFAEAQEAVDRHHEDFVCVQKRLRELNKKEEHQHRGPRIKERETVKAEAEEIYQKFKEGETFEAEDLMRL